MRLRQSMGGSDSVLVSPLAPCFVQPALRSWHVLKSPPMGVQVKNEHFQNHLLAPLCLSFPSIKLRYHVPCSHGFQVLWARIISNNIYVQYLKLSPGVSVPSQYSCFTKNEKKKNGRNWAEGMGGGGKGGRIEREKKKRKYFKM